MRIYEIEKSIGFLLAKAYQRGWAMFSVQIVQYDLTPPQFSLLAFLWQQDGLTQAELSELSQIDRTTMVGLIDRMQRNGLLERRNHPHDRRANQIFLTSRGQDLQPELSLVANQVLDQFTSCLTDHDKQELVRMLNLLRMERITDENTDK